MRKRAEQNRENGSAFIPVSTSIINSFNTEWNLPSIVLGQLKSSVGVKGLILYEL